MCETQYEFIGSNDGVFKAGMSQPIANCLKIQIDMIARFSMRPFIRPNSLINQQINKPVTQLKCFLQLYYHLNI